MPYAVATLDVHTDHAGVDDIRSRSDLLADLTAVVDAEGPVHRDRCVEAMRAPWAITRMTAKVRAAIDESLATLAGQGVVVVTDGAFVARPHQSATLVRGAVDGDDATVRRAGEVPLAELEAALEQVVADSHTIAADELTARVARIFGWTRRRADIATALGRALDQLERSGRVARDDRGNLVSPSAHPGTPGPAARSGAPRSNE